MQRQTLRTTELRARVATSLGQRNERPRRRTLLVRLTPRAESAEGTGTGTRVPMSSRGSGCCVGRCSGGAGVLQNSKRSCLFYLLLLLGEGCHLAPQRGGMADARPLGTPVVFCIPPGGQWHTGPGLLLPGAPSWCVR